MIYIFLKFKFDSQINELFYTHKIVALSKQHKKLLKYFLNNPDRPLSKKILIEHVWNGRMVAGNTIDQSLSKLKKILNECQPDKYFETVYGQGMRFLPKVYNPNKINNRTMLGVLFLVLGISVVSYCVINRCFSSHVAEKNIDFKRLNPPISLMVVPQPQQIKIADIKNTWLNESSSVVVEQLIKYGGFFQLKSYTKKPANLNKQQYLDYMWDISHELNTLSVALVQKNDAYTLELVLTTSKQVESTYSWSDEKLNKVFILANKWLTQQFPQHTFELHRNNILAESNYQMGLYMRGLSSVTHDKLLKASHFFELCINNNPAFLLARLELVKIRLIQGKGKESLRLLDTVPLTNVSARLSIEVLQLRSQAYLIENENEKAIATLNKAITQFKENEIPETGNLRYTLSSVYLNLKHYELALKTLTNISIDISKNPELAARVLQRKAIIYLTIKNTKKAKEAASQALEIHLKLGNSLASAKSHRLLAKIAIQLLEYKSAETHLQQSLSIYRMLSSFSEDSLHRLDRAENVNELIPVLIDQGHLIKAKYLNDVLQQLAMEGHFSDKLIDSKTYTVVMAIMLKKWSSARKELQELKVLANETNNKAAIINNQLLSIELLLAQNVVTRVKSLLLKLHKDIETTENEALVIRTNILQARYYILAKETQKGIAFLISIKTSAQSIKDSKNVVEINNILAQHYLRDKQSNKAISVLQDSKNLKPFSYPYLLLKSKANMQLGNTMRALELAIELKSSQLWSEKDEEYLIALIEHNKSL